LGRRAQRRIVLDGHGGGCPSHTPSELRRLRRSTAGCQATVATVDRVVCYQSAKVQKQGSKSA